jgi:DNA segregation ATPase FtsK/SpoIIIE-like protein
MTTREVVFLTGKSGSGKSTLCRQLLLTASRLLVFDTISEYRRLSPPFPALTICNVYDLMDYLTLNAHKNFRVIFDPADPEEVIELKNGEKLTIFDFVCKVILDSLTNITFCIEEIANFVEGGKAPVYLRKIARYGRHSAINIYATTQRPADVPPVLRAQITKFITFKQHEPRDIEWIRQIIGQEAETLSSLEQFKWPSPLVSGKHYKEYQL